MNEVRIKAQGVGIYGNLNIPKDAKGIVIFAHGSGSGRFSPRNNFVAEELNKKNIATLLVDLLTADEEAYDEITAQLRFNIDFLAERLDKIADWVKENKDTGHLKIGYFGASTGAAAALMSAAKRGDIKAIVSRGGRPDLAEEYLKKVTAPTLLIVGGNDTIVIELNEKALKELKIEKKISIIPKATHLFEEPGALEEVARQAAEWFMKYLRE